MSAIMEMVVSRLAGPYQRLMAKKLTRSGLAIEDLFVEKGEFETAVKRIDGKERVDRERRIARAFDLSIKRKELSAEAAAEYDPFREYLQKALDEAKAEAEEKEMIRG